MTDRKTLRRLITLAVIAAGCLPGSLWAADVPPLSPPAARDTVAAREALVPEVEPAEEVAETSADAALLNQAAIDDIPLQMNSDVLRYIEFFTGAGRSTFERWLKRSGKYMELFRTVLQKEGLPPDLVHLVFVESGFNVNAKSYASAVGPWQFMKATSKLFGLNVNQWVDERKDPEKATVAAARYLKHLYGIFGDWPLALASYNAGEGTVLRAIKKQGTTNYWDLKLPQQTEDYVPQFMAALAITRDPVRYGFSEVELDDPLRFDEVALKGAVDLRAIARLAGCTVEELKELNPAVRNLSVRGNEGVTTLRVPEGKSEIIMAAMLSGQQLPQADVTVRHRVRRNETLRTIAREYGVNAKELARVNGITSRRPLKRGMLVTIPATRASVSTPEIVTSGTDPRASTGYVPSRRIGLPAKIQGNSSQAVVSHVVKPGETLLGIAQTYGLAADDLRAQNSLESDVLRPGQRLSVRQFDAETAAADSAQIATMRAPGMKKQAAVSERSNGAGAKGAKARATHTVRKGETLSEIASQHGVSVSALKRANGLRSNTVRSGQRLKLPA
ncbi:MAG: LysM peptidoglycan-binding domain-containing protein [Candidatus Eisenbacteria bacterium]|uniref:LysM peptidoglycan-binding domain-containing protein n=1 Tax=Eiseniibacteriota bacterium TaxID=2212470 RepID=A0A933W3T1_UNCEI|nr:LysM peptidoglycan-binding domain-containing protein [Candidatus Eisenbacteria bacterium]